MPLPDPKAKDSPVMLVPPLSLWEGDLANYFWSSNQRYLAVVFWCRYMYYISQLLSRNFFTSCREKTGFPPNAGKMAGKLPRPGGVWTLGV